MKKRLATFVALIALAIFGLSLSSSQAADDKPKVSLVYSHLLPNVPGKSIRGVLVEYQPGGSSPAHTHPKSAICPVEIQEPETINTQDVLAFSQRPPVPIVALQKEELW